MKQAGRFSPSEKRVVEQLLQGKSNKQIAAALGISERTVEFHLKNIYEKLNVGSRGEAILQLGKTTGAVSKGHPEESTVGEKGETGYGKDVLKWTFEREAKFPDDHTVGQTIPRSNAFGLEVHGLFGAVPAWPARSGYARYDSIRIPNTARLYIKLRYSKHSPALVPILIFIDHEDSPRTKIFPQDQGNWNRFIWTDPIPLGEVESGVHSITFYTEGQEYGVADLDRFILTTEPP